VTTNGALKLFFTQFNGRLEDTEIELESVTSSDDLITHASLCSDKSIVLASPAYIARSANR
jgi:mediator of RNA polymerase II transcription subunit 16